MVMPRFRVILASLALALAPMAVLTVGGPAATAAAPRALLVGELCQTALDPPARAVSVTAVMRPVTGTEKLAVEFQLLERSTVTSSWTAVAGPGLGVWLSPTSPATLGQRPNDVWLVKKPVADLDAPASYRFEVSFRWLGSGGTVLQTVTQLSRVCRQPELRPDLAVESVTVSAGSSSSTLYTALIENLGLTGAGPFTVQLSQAGTEVSDRTVAHLGPHAHVYVRLRGPACDQATPPTVTVDPNDQIDVYSRTQATLAAQCSGTSTNTGTTTTGPVNGPASPPPPGSGAADGIPVSG